MITAESTLMLDMRMGVAFGHSAATITRELLAGLVAGLSQPQQTASGAGTVAERSARFFEIGKRMKEKNGGKPVKVGKVLMAMEGMK